MNFMNLLDWSKTESGLHSIILQHIMTCTRVSEATRAEYQQKYLTSMAQCLQIFSGGEVYLGWAGLPSHSATEFLLVDPVLDRRANNLSRWAPLRRFNFCHFLAKWYGPNSQCTAALGTVISQGS